MQRRSHRLEKLARIYDDEILPVWAERFGRMLLRDLDIAPGAQVLNVSCATGYITLELLRHMGVGCRLIAIDERSAMLDVTRKKLKDVATRDVFVRGEKLEPRLSFANDVYDLVVGNLTLADAADPGRVLAELARVTQPGGELRLTLPLAGSFREFLDIYAEVLMKYDNHAARDRLDDYMRTELPTEDVVESWAADCGLVDVHLDIEEFELLFQSSREFFFAPVIEHGPLPQWKAIAGSGRDMQDVFWYIKEAIDSYYTGSAFAVTVRAGCLVAKVPGIGADKPVDSDIHNVDTGESLRG